MNDTFLVAFIIASIIFIFVNPRVLAGMGAILLLWSVLCFLMNWSWVWVGCAAGIFYGIVKADEL